MLALTNSTQSNTDTETETEFDIYEFHNDYVIFTALENYREFLKQTKYKYHHIWDYQNLPAYTNNDRNELSKIMVSGKFYKNLKKRLNSNSTSKLEGKSNDKSKNNSMNHENKEYGEDYKINVCHASMANFNFFNKSQIVTMTPDSKMNLKITQIIQTIYSCFI